MSTAALLASQIDTHTAGHETRPCAASVDADQSALCCRPAAQAAGYALRAAWAAAARRGRPTAMQQRCESGHACSVSPLPLAWRCILISSDRAVYIRTVLLLLLLYQLGEITQ